MVFSSNVLFLCAFPLAGSRFILTFELCDEVVLRNIAGADVAQGSLRLGTCLGRQEQTGHCPEGGVAVHSSLETGCSFCSLKSCGVFLNAGKGRRSKLGLHITVYFLIVNPWCLCIGY